MSDVALIKRIMASQVSGMSACGTATHVLDNSTSLDDLYQQIEPCISNFWHWRRRIDGMKGNVECLPFVGFPLN
ncbi:MAG: hypothetical protein R3E89_10135 [Thiolinea sp.]